MKLSATDLQLYLAGALPASKRLMMDWALLVDGGLRAELRSLRERNAAYREREMPRLQRSLYPHVAHAAGGQAPARSARTPAFPRFPGASAQVPGLACAFALMVLCVLPFFPGTRAKGMQPDSVPTGFDASAVSDPDFIAKGRGLGVSLFVKGDIAYRVENQAAKVAATDTLQVMPLGSEAQHLVLLGWDARQGLVRLFPKDGEQSRRVSRLDPPPALLLQDMAENRLICVTAVAPFRIADAEAALKRAPFLPMEKAPPFRLQKGLYLQIFAITKGGTRI